jgi:hypothetical protein
VTFPSRAVPRIPRRARELAVLALLASPAALLAQGTVTGTVRDSACSPVAIAEVTIEGTTIRTTTDGTGAFRLGGVPAGDRIVRARRIGFRAAERPVSVADGATATVAITLSALARELDAVVVQAALDKRARYLSGFYQRRKIGVGRFLTQEALDRHVGASLPQILMAELPGVRVSSGRNVHQAVRLRGNSCPPLVWVDGTPAPAAEFDLSTLPPQSVGAVEVYFGPATVPGEFQMSRGLHACGVVVIWSRMYDGQPRRRPRKPSPSLDSALAQLKVYTSAEVTQPARVDSARFVTPMYPDSLYAYRVEGEVLAEFVIDTTGEAREGSIGIIDATHPLFAVAAERAILASRFEPARHEGRKVPQVMVLPFRFQLQRTADSDRD